MSRCSATVALRPRATRRMSQRPIALAAWLIDNGESVAPPLTVARVGSGRSKITSVVTDGAGHQWVMCEPGPGQANNLDREAHIMSMLARSGVPLPRVVGSGAARTGAAFMVMRRALGLPIITEDDARTLPVGQRYVLGIEMVAILARLHSLDPAAAGQPRYTSPYLDRQIARMTDVWTRWGSVSAHDSAWRAVRSRLLQRRPARQSRPMVLHGDFRLSNILTHRGGVSAVLDWELCTAGDPMADLAWLLDDWRSPDEPAICLPSPTRAGGFPSRSKLVDVYQQATGSSLETLGYHRGFAHWRGATLLQSILARGRAVQRYRTPVAAELFDDSIARLLTSAADFLVGPGCD
jgi:aminoglycoside phosphotransferase (APT) family kinase protein